MDDNTAKVLMALIALISGIVTPIVVVWVGLIQARKIKSIQAQVGGVETKLDENHKLMNGNIDKLMKSTADLATANEKARVKGDSESNKKPGL